METLKKIVTIPKNHHLKLDVTLPESFPTGEVEMVIFFSSKKRKEKGNLLSLAGKLKNSSNFSGDPLTLQKKLRDEWEK
ncbi:MAG: DUF2281 domain-containing protein [Gammaproteobacteria bacterium]|nr:MAG: DUF2281 domain-containing protein [Gammaproteobacteria bacterium]